MPPLAETKPSSFTLASCGSSFTIIQAPRSWGMLSKPQQLTTRTRCSRALAPQWSITRSTNAGSPVRSA